AVGEEGRDLVVGQLEVALGRIVADLRPVKKVRRREDPLERGSKARRGIPEDLRRALGEIEERGEARQILVRRWPTERRADRPAQELVSAGRPDLSAGDQGPERVVVEGVRQLLGDAVVVLRQG